MELCSGTLDEYFEERIKDLPLGALNSRSILGQIVVGLSYLHGKDMIHKDLKPENILAKVTTCGNVLWKLSDFGFARMLPSGQRNFKETDNCGTVGYISPELLESNRPTFESDVWALGAVAFFVVSGGQHPYHIPGSDLDEMAERLLLIPSLRAAPGINSIADWAATDLICRLLNYKPQVRPNVFLVLHHPYFSLANETTKKYFAFKVFSFCVQCQPKIRNKFTRLFRESEVVQWYDQYESYLKTEEDQEELDSIVALVTK